MSPSSNDWTDVSGSDATAPDAASAPDHPDDALAAWEASFGDGVAASSRVRSHASWVGGHVHVLDVDAADEPVQTGLVPHHQVLLIMKEARLHEKVVGMPATWDGIIRPGDMVIANAAHTAQEMYSWWDRPMRAISIFLKDATIAQACQALDLAPATIDLKGDLKGNGVISGVRDPLLESIMRRLASEVEAGAPGGRLYAEQLMQTFAVHLLQTYADHPTANQPPSGGLTPKMLARVEAYVRAHLSHDLSLGDLAEQVGLSPHHFCREFGQTTGETPFQFVARLRMEQAARILKAHPDRLVMQVAFDVGYASASPFATAFKRYHGLTPTQYRAAVE